MTVFNGERFVEEAVRSVLAQGYQPLELVIVDDGSTDGSPAILDRLASDRVRVIHTENRGVGAARNAGLSAARGDLVAFLDQDDALTPDSIERRVGPSLRSPKSFVYGALEWWGASPDGSKTSPPPEHVPSTKYAEAWAKVGITTPGQVLAWRSELLAAGGFPEDRAHGGSDDRGMWLRLMARGVMPLFLPDVVLRYRVHPSQASKTIAFKRARLAMREALVMGGDPPRRLVSEETAAPVLAALELDLAYDLLDVDPDEATRTAEHARTRCPSIGSTKAWGAFRRKRQRKVLSRIPLIGPVGRALWRLFSAEPAGISSPTAIAPLGRRARWIAAAWVLGVVVLYALARLHVLTPWATGQ